MNKFDGIIQFEFKWQDMWIGVFYKREAPIPRKHLWICFIPMLPLHIMWYGKVSTKAGEI